ncbi:DNA ligase [Roseomonas sp. NAR14]|uniref:DNA ligase n=1 Tax=Roseomonas acroporae TaxID=2937791 RepID=A0A9X1YEI4_9PROT|nr:DNA ligase [Roseomonas acroporae]
MQKHAARRLHWDFRLEHGGVLWSWAVPKGPSMDPADRRLAVRVEDHALGYARFEGTIAAGSYGAGTVALWDEGFWEPPADPARDLAAGALKFRLAGRRLRGGFTLVRFRPRGGRSGDDWLLIKERDAEARPGLDAAAIEAADGVPPRAAPDSPARPARG